MKKIIYLFIAILLIFTSRSFAQTELNWYLDGGTYTAGSPSTFSFDVLVGSNTAGTDANGLSMRIVYNEDVFSNISETNVVLNPEFTDQFPIYFWLPTITTDVPGEITVSSFTLYGADDGQEIPSEAPYLNYCTITLEVQASCEDAGISFVSSFMDGSSTYWTTTTYPDGYSTAYTSTYENDWTEQLVYPAPPTTTWIGTTSDWLDATNWSDGFPCTGSVVTIPDVGITNYPIMDVNGFCDDVTISTGGKLTVNSGATLTVANNLTVKSTSAGNGSFINNGTLTAGSTSVESYVTASQWHGISAPVIGLTADDLYLPQDVWLLEFNESTNGYIFIESLLTTLDPMKGFFTWIFGTTDETYSFTGDFNTGTISADLTVSAGPGEGYNLVGNPFSSAIDWEAASGWGGTATVSDNIWVYDNDNWKVYNRNTQAGLQTRYIAMNQAFFVEASSAGTLTMTNEVCAHDDVPFRKAEMADQQVIKISLEDNGLIDETFIVLKEGATVDYEGTFDAHKLFSFNEEYPQLYSTGNNNMAINSLPYDYRDAVALDVRGANGNTMTISLEAVDFEELYLRDEFTGTVTDLKTTSYTFTYNSEVSDRFSLFFSPTGVDEDPILNDIRIFAFDKNIQVVLDDNQINTNITVYNLMGQKITSRFANSSVTTIPVYKSGYYVVKVSDGKYVSSQKVFIK